LGTLLLRGNLGEIALQLLVTFACAIGALASLYAIARIALLG
jgi:succinate dehydrogenase / fumarate reductase membrane anchor subunit